MKTEFSSARSFLDTLMVGEDAPHLLVALSGGEDSMCLTHFVRAWCMERGAKLTAAHLNHGIRGDEAERDADFVKKLCKGWRIPCYQKTVDVPALARQMDVSEETAGRLARYQFFRELTEEKNAKCLLT